MRELGRRVVCGSRYVGRCEPSGPAAADAVAISRRSDRRFAEREFGKKLVGSKRASRQEGKGWR